MRKTEFGAALSESALRSMITEDTEWFIEQIEREEEIPKKILIKPFLVEGLQPASYDIHLGDEYISHLTGKIGKLDSTKKLVIKPGETVTITSLEFIGLPQDITALITSRTDLVLKGLSQMSTHIDPGFYGKIFQTFTNLSNRNVELEYKAPIAHLTFFKVEGAEPQRRYKGKRLRQEKLDAVDPDLYNEIKNTPGSAVRVAYLYKRVYDVWIGLLSFMTSLSAYFTISSTLPPIPGILITGASVATLILFVSSMGR
jgi:deoxycytidine triphosphate deaminase